MNTKHEEEFNVALGRRLSMIRRLHKMSLEHLGAMLGVSHQQVHKYETGETPIGPRRIHICAKLFNVPVGYFYGEDESGMHQPSFDKTVLTIAAEVQKLPDDIRKGVYHLSRQINKSFTETSDRAKEEQAA